ncbi:hypothetical protein Q7C36_018935 [Tachysurus vachellii]|uniref:Uncharacterized protein n=1 Tax=Tachysurus vachellii TaxID=175792 RepID=A0AA88LVF1_TACVA|nr:hypothetical protein Q7C36_018935 [Tachysurus vachellii]
MCSQTYGEERREKGGAERRGAEKRRERTTEKEKKGGERRGTGRWSISVNTSSIFPTAEKTAAPTPSSFPASAYKQA